MFEEPLEPTPRVELPYRHSGRRLVVIGLVTVALAYVLAATGALQGPTELKDFLALSRTPAPNQPALPEVEWGTILEHARGDRGYAEQTAVDVLPVYNKVNVFGSGGLSEGQVAVRLYAIYAAAGDFYGEGLLQAAYFYAEAALAKGSVDPLVVAVRDAFPYAGKRATDVADDFVRRSENLAALERSGYPAVVKFAAAVAELGVASRTSAAGGFGAESVPVLADAALENLREMAKSPTPERLLVTKASMLMDALGASSEQLARMGPATDEVLVQAGVPENELAVFRASLLMAQAWASRGATPESGEVMAQRLREAADMLRAAAEKFPQDAWIPAMLMQAELAEGKGKDRMIYWFDRAVGIDPKLRKAYSNRMSDVQPAWQGSQLEVLAFGKACVATGFWEEKIPLVQVDGIVTLANGAAPVYDDNSIWEMLRDTTVEYLKRYPKSISYRTLLLRYAVRAGKWDTATEQMAVLGNDWDRQSMSDQQYDRIRKLVANQP